MKFSICGLGCKVNTYEAESIASSLEKRGCERVAFEEPADVSLIFTCAVTNTAAQKSRQMMHRVRRLNPQAVVAMIVLTEDDPRNEKPVEIAKQIASGIKHTNYVIIEDRYDAIRQAIELAGVNDTIILLGKGDESFIYREFGREPYEGDDKIAREVLHKYYFSSEEDAHEGK